MNRRTALRLIGTSGAAAVAAPTLFGGEAGAATAPQSSPLLLSGPDRLSAPPAEGIHLTFGADPAREMNVSWSTLVSVHQPRVRFGSAEGGFGAVAQAETRTYIDGTSNREVYIHHATLTGLQPNRRYVYLTEHSGGIGETGFFRTAPRGRAPFTFTSFGDQATPNVTWQNGTSGFTSAPDSLSGPGSADIVLGIEQIAPLFHLLNGDLCYANLSPDRLRTWHDFFANNSRSTRFRPWMPAAGNHENEKGNGPIGYSSFQTRFAVPGNGSADFDGLWYAFTAGSVRVVVVQNDDVAFQDAGDSYVSGYSGGEQRAWLERELRAARADKSIDWIVVCMHQVMISSSDANGADLGIRQQFGPLFDQYEVDLVLCGHEHDYERSLALRGVVSGSETLTPNPVSSELANIDTSQGTVHMVLGGGGTSAPSNQKFFTPEKAKVITGVGAPVNGKRPPVYVFEDAPWIGVRDETHPYGFAAFTVDPGDRPGGTTSIHVTYYNVVQPYGTVTPLESFTLHRKRGDGR